MIKITEEDYACTTFSSTMPFLINMYYTCDSSYYISFAKNILFTYMTKLVYITYLHTEYIIYYYYYYVAKA